MDTARPLVLRSTAVLGLTTTFYLSGYGFSASHLALPPLYAIPQQHALKVFKYVFQAGKPAFIALSATSVLSSAIASYLAAVAAASPLDSTTVSSVLAAIFTGKSRAATAYAAAAALTLSTLPLTQIIMMPGILTLVKCEEDSAVRAKVGEQGVARLLQSWQAWNVLRSGVLVAAGVASAVASFGA